MSFLPPAYRPLTLPLGKACLAMTGSFIHSSVPHSYRLTRTTLGARHRAQGPDASLDPCGGPTPEQLSTQAGTLEQTQPGIKTLLDKEGRVGNICTDWPGK